MMEENLVNRFTWTLKPEIQWNFDVVFCFYYYVQYTGYSKKEALYAKTGTENLNLNRVIWIIVYRMHSLEMQCYDGS